MIGPNMIYLASRAVCQGRAAALVAAAVGLTALFLAVPLGYEMLKWAGAAYLAWLGGSLWLAAQRNVMGAVLGGLALRLALDERRAA